MKQETMYVLEQLKKEGGQNKKINLILAVIAAASWIVGMVGLAPNLQPLMVVGVLVSSILFIVLFFRGLGALGRKICLKKSLQTLEATGSIQYVDEILKKQYKSTGKEYLSKHLYYIPGVFVMAYKDILDIRRVNNEYYFVTIDGRQHRVGATKAKKETITMLINSFPITSGAPYREYKDKIEQFKKEHCK